MCLNQDKGGERAFEKNFLILSHPIMVPQS